MHIVVLTGDFYPNLMAPSACIKPYLVELAKDNEVEVICPLTAVIVDRMVVTDNIKVHFVSSWLNVIQIKAKTKILQFLLRAVKYLQEIASPKPYNSMLEKAYLDKMEEITQRAGVDAILSVTFPFCTHVVALKYKQHHPEVKWLSYTTDPLAHNEANPIPAWKRRMAKRIEQRVYNDCDYCLITEELKSDLVEGYHIPQQKIIALPYLLETENAFVEIEGAGRERVKAIYAGYFFYRVRNPRTMLDAFSKMPDIDLQLYATGDRTCRRMLKGVFPSNIMVHGLVSREAYFNLLNRADVLVNLSNKARLQAPHKLMELISTGRPIINFFYYQDAGYRIIEKYPLGINVPYEGGIDDIVKAIAAFVAEVDRKRLSKTEIEGLFPEYLLSYQMAQVRHALND